LISVPFSVFQFLLLCEYELDAPLPARLPLSNSPHLRHSHHQGHGRILGIIARSPLRYDIVQVFIGSFIPILSTSKMVEMTNADRNATESDSAPESAWNGTHLNRFSTR